MEKTMIRKQIRQFHGTSKYHRHLFPGRSPILLTDGCKYVRDVCKANWLFDTILRYQCEPALNGVNFQVWELKQLNKDLSWQLTCKEERLPIIKQVIEYSEFPLNYIKIWVIDKVALLPSEY